MRNSNGRLAQDEVEKIEALFCLYYKYLIQIANYYVHSVDTAEDIVCEAYERVIDHLDKIKYADSNHAKRYLIVTVENICFSHLRMQKRLQNLDEHNEAVGKETVWDEFNAAEIKAKAALFAQELPEPERAIFINGVLNGYSYIELAQKYKIKKETMASKLSRLKKKFHDYIFK